MRKVLLTLFVVAASTMTASAQNVYKEIQRLSVNISADPKKSNEERSIGLFRVDALDYMAIKARELTPDSSAVTLDSQAYGMYEFIVNYKEARERAKSENGKRNVMKVFKEASLACPRYNDPEKETTMVYVNETKNNVTPFCLDTDWVKAVEIIKEKGYCFIQ